MLLNISHRTVYSYDTPVVYALQRVRLSPQSGATQDVLNWAVDIAGAQEEVRFSDHFGNKTKLLSVSGTPHIEIRAGGAIEVRDTQGVTGAHTSPAPLWLFQGHTALTSPGPLITYLAKAVEGKGDIDRLHNLAAMIAERVSYTTGSTDATTAAEDALLQGQGVCQDHAHIFLSAARTLGYPARYVSGYLLIDGQTAQVATHAWAEAHVDGLGWLAFDVSNGISPDGRYVRLATGRDYRDAMPISGIRLGQAQEVLDVHITVEQ